MDFAQTLLGWYEQKKRDLPWRMDKDPYRIWVSEIMLQQTRVEAVREYYDRWIKRFPTLADLAAASEEEVLTYWQGLGYYSRARNLWQGVREVAENYGGSVPDRKEAIRALPGIGEYTTGAILSIAYNQQISAVDGNVVRIYSRLFCLGVEPEAALKKTIISLVEGDLPQDRPGDFNQALMDLGATVCIPANPRCDECPVQSFCQSFAAGRQQEFPPKKKKNTVKSINLMAGVIENKETFLLQRRPDKGLLAGMWEFPTVEIESGDDPPTLEEAMQQRTGQRVKMGEKLMDVTHIFSHRRWEIAFHIFELIAPEQLPLEPETCWASIDSFDQILFAGPHRKAASMVAQRK